MRKTVIFKLWAQVATFVMLVMSVQVVSIKSAPPAQAAQADLTASIEAPGVMAPPAFGDLITETFDVPDLNNGRNLAIGTISTPTGTVTAQSGGTSANPTSTTYTITGTSRGTTAAEVWGGAGGTGRYASVTTSSSLGTSAGGVQFDLPDHAGVSPVDDTYRYVGFWWSAGNAPNIVRLLNNGSETATFTTTNLLNQLGTAVSGVCQDYFGNPSTTFNSDGTSRAAGDPNTAPCPTVTTVSGSPGSDEPFAFIHLRLSSGFDQIQFLGRGFEFDSISIRRFVPASSAGETSIVGSGVVSSCNAFSNQNAQYVLRNGSFEDPYLTNAAGTTTASITSAMDARPAGSRGWITLSDSTSGAANRIQFWQTSAGDDQVELQRQLAGSEASSTRNGANYLDFFPRPADGDIHAEINANTQAALFQDIVTIGGQRITWSIKHRGRFFGQGNTSSSTSSTGSDDKDKFEILIGPSSGTLSAQTPARRRSPDVVWNTSNTTYTNNAFTTFTTNTSGHTAGTMYTRLEDGWVLYTGTYTVPTNQNSTRFSFSSRGTGSSGNLIDDIGFDPIIACPRTVTIQANVTANYPMSPLLESQIPNYTYPDTTTVDSVSVNGGSGTADISQSQIQLQSNAVGNYQVLYTLRDVNNQTSTSTITVNVEDADTQLPQVLLVDPRATTVSLPSQTISGSTNAMLCIEQVDNASATTLTGSPSISVGRSSNVANVTFTSATNSWRFTGTRANVQSQVPSINIIGVGSNPVVSSGSKFVRIGVTAATTMGASVCYTGENRVVELRALDLRGSETKSLTLD